MNKRILLIALFLLSAGFQSAVQALALSELELKSYLHQPLNVEIPLAFSKQSELDGLKLSIGRVNNESQGLQTWRSLRVEIIENDGSQPYLKITSKNTIREPAISFVLDMRWPGGHIQREYSLFLDLRP